MCVWSRAIEIDLVAVNCVAASSIKKNSCCQQVWPGTMRCIYVHRKVTKSNSSIAHYFFKLNARRAMKSILIQFWAFIEGIPLTFNAQKMLCLFSNSSRENTPYTHVPRTRNAHRLNEMQWLILLPPAIRLFSPWSAFEFQWNHLLACECKSMYWPRFAPLQIHFPMHLDQRVTYCWTKKVSKFSQHTHWLYITFRIFTGRFCVSNWVSVDFFVIDLLLNLLLSWIFFF